MPATVTLYTRCGWYYARVRRPHGTGRSLRYWLRTKNEAEAKQLLKDGKFEELARADHADALVSDVWTRLIAGKRIRVRDSIDKYRDHRTVIGRPPLVIKHEQLALDQFVRFTTANSYPDFAHATIAALEAKHIADWINAEDGTKLSYREGRLTTLKTWLDWNVQMRWLIRNPAIDVTVRLEGLTQEQLMVKSHEPFTEDEVKRLLTIIPRTDYWHGAVLFGHAFGLTIGSVAMLEESNVVGHTLRAYRTKGRRIVNERLTDELIAWLEEWKAVRPASDMPYLFPVQAALYSGGASLSMQFKAWVVKAGIEGKSFHSLRVSATRNRWSKELDELGTEDKRRLMALVAEKGFRAVQTLLAHAPGSSVTDVYMPKTP